MSNAGIKHIMLIKRRNIWLYSLLSLLITFVSWIIIVFPFEGSIIKAFYEAHLELPILLIIDFLPLIVFGILSNASKNLQNEIDLIQDELQKNAEIQKKNSQYATKISEGEDPSLFTEMLESDLGRALKLIHLNIKSNRRKEKELTWITEGKDIISRILRVHNELDELSYQILKSLSKYIEAIQGAVYIYNEEEETLKNIAVLAYNRRKFIDQKFSIGEGLVGQCAYEMDYIYRTEIPEDYISISSGILGDQKPRSILLIPLITNEKLQGIMEFAFLENRIPKLTIQFMLELGEIIARTVFNLKVNEKTRDLLKESRDKTEELRKNEMILQENAQLMKSTQNQLQKTNLELENKIEEARNAQDRLHWLLENASEIISIYDKNHRLKYISPSAERILGYSLEEMVKGKDFDRIDQKGTKAIHAAFDASLENPEEKILVNYSYIRKDGSRLHLQSSIKNYLNDPSIKGFIFNTRDITESLLIEKEQRMKSRMQSLSENSLDIIIRLTTSGIVRYVNPVIEDYTGISSASILNKPISDIPFDKAVIETFNTALLQISGNPIKFVMERSLPVLMGENTKDRILSFSIIPEFQDNELETVLIVGHDITESKRIEAEIKVNNRKIKDSINYAERIQSSLLPSSSAIKKAFPKSFVYYMPKDVISGDIPWFYEDKDAWYIAAIDCTGHGVPGALLSFIAFFLLNNICATNPHLSASEICDIFNDEVRKTLKQDRKKPETRDGMDLAFCKIHKNDNIVEYVGAHRPMYVLREGELIVYKGDRKSIGGIESLRNPVKNFENNTLQYRNGDKLFIFSDGLTDQLGGEKGLKYTPARVRDVLLNNAGYTIQQFDEIFRKDFRKWLGKHKQTDDVILIGIELQ